MTQETKHPITNENDKYKKAAGREAFENEEETKFLDKEALKDDIQDSDVDIDNHGVVIDSNHTENQEWHAREAQNKH